jgi:hypothetical protein
MGYNSTEEWRKNKDTKRDEFMTKDEMAEINDYIAKLNDRIGDMSALFAEWEDIEKHYCNDQAEIPKRPNSRVNLMNANIEGQVSQLVEQNIAVVTRGEGPSDQSYAGWARIGLDWTLRKNHVKRILDVHERRRLLFGVGVLNVCFDHDAIGKFGLAKIHPTPLNMLFVDGSIKDVLRFNESEYMCEIVYVSKTYMKDRFVKDKASAVDYGNYVYRDNGVFSPSDSVDDENTAPLILLWSRQEGKLRLREVSGCGLLLYDSHKKGGRKDNQKNVEESIKSYYKYVDDRYPYFLTGMYPIEGDLYGFGDGKLILPLQKLINELYDKIRICARPNLILIDTNADVSLEDFDENSLEPRYYDGSAVQGMPIHKVEYGIINQGWWALLDKIHDEIQRITRFSDLMIGQAKSADTATEASIQLQQGNASTNHKKLMLQETLIEVCEYCLGLMMEFYTEAKAFRISEDKDEYEWIDFREMTTVPVKKPATEAFSKMYSENNADVKPPEWELIEENGKPKTKRVDLDIEINIGAGLPKNKVFLWQMAQQLASMRTVDMAGQEKPAITYEELRNFMRDYLGIPLKTDAEVQQIFSQPPPGTMPQPTAQPTPVSSNPSQEGSQFMASY